MQVHDHDSIYIQGLFRILGEQRILKGKKKRKDEVERKLWEGGPWVIYLLLFLLTKVSLIWWNYLLEENIKGFWKAWTNSRICCYNTFNIKNISIINIHLFSTKTPFFLNVKDFSIFPCFSPSKSFSYPPNNVKRNCFNQIMLKCKYCLEGTYKRPISYTNQSPFELTYF